MGIMETVKKGFSLMLSSLSVVAIFFAYGVATNFTNAQLTSRVQSNPANTASPLLIASILLSLAFVVLGLYLQASSMGYFKEKLKSGQATLGTFFTSGKKYFVPLLFFGLIIMAIVGAATIASVMMIRMLPRPVAIAGSVVLVIAALFFVILWFLAPYSIVVSHKGVSAAIKESAELVKKNLAKILLIGLVLVLIGFLIGFVFGLITGVGGAIINQRGGGTVPQGVIALMSSIVNAFLGVFMTSTYMYFYLKVTHQEHATTA